MFSAKAKNVCGIVTIALGLAASNAWGLVITANPSTDPDFWIPLLVAPGGGITVVPGSGTFQGAGAVTGGAQSGTYTGFNLVPNSGSTPTLTLADGITLTSGLANVPLTNTINDFSRTTGSGSNALLTALGGSSLDSNVIQFNFTLAPGQNSVSTTFVFGTDEFPTQSVTDIFGFFVDGVNFAKFPNGQLISNTPGNPTNFISNPVASDPYDIEYNGLTQVFQVTGLINPNLSVHTLTIGIADTSDTIFQSGVFIPALVGGTATGGGGITDPNAVPEPAMLGLLGIGLAGLAAVRRRKAAV